MQTTTATTSSSRPPEPRRGLRRETVLQTPLGPLVPQHSTDDLRRKEILPVERFGNGALRSLPLERQSLVPTPAGHLPAELVTFYPTGALKRIFPLNGRLSGYWTQEDEAALAEPLTLQTPAGPIHARLISVAFHENGDLRSIALWPGERLTVRTPAGPLEAHMGLAFWNGGALRSLEPARPQAVATPCGEVLAFDTDAVGISGDCGSLSFTPEGDVAAVATVQSCIETFLSDGTSRSICPDWRESLCGLEEREPVPLRLAFRPPTLLLRRDQAAEPMLLPLAHCRAMQRPLALDPRPAMACGM